MGVLVIQYISLCEGNCPKKEEDHSQPHKAENTLEGYEAIKGEMNFNDAQPNKARDGGTISVHDPTL